MSTGSIRRQFSAVFIVTLALSLAAAGAVLSELYRTQKATRDFMLLGAARLELAHTIESKLYQSEAAEDTFLSRAQPGDLERFRALNQEMRAAAERLRNALDEGDARAAVERLLGHAADYATLVAEEAQVTMGEKAITDAAAFRALLVRRGEALAGAQADTRQVLEGVLAAGPVYANRVEQSFGRLGLWMLALLMTVAVGGFATWIAGNRIVRRVSSMAAAIGEITTAGDLDRRLPVGGSDELGTLSTAFNSLLSAEQNSLRELKKSQHKLMESDKLATIGQLSAGIAHEVNNPATAVIGNLEFVKQALEPVLAEWEQREPGKGQVVADLRESVDDSLIALQRISAIVRELGVFARQKDEMEPVLVSEPIDVAIKIATFETKYRAQVVREYRKVPPITGNRGRLQQLFLNLIVNAAHAIPKGDVDHHFIRVSVEQVAEHVLVAVGDSGNGIAPEHLARIFDPFFTTKPAGQGTGLGLAITNDIAHEHGAEITVESQLGRGTTFTLRFPVNRSLST